MSYKKLMSFAFTGLLGLFLALPAIAQHRGGGGGGGRSFGGGGGFGGGRSGGGGGFSRGGGSFGGGSRPSGGSFSRPSGGSFSRPNSTFSRPQGGSFNRPQGSFSQGGGFNRSPRVNGYNNNGFRGTFGLRPGVGNRGNYAYRGGNYGRGSFRGGYYGGYRNGYRSYNYGPRYFNRGFYNYRGYYNSYYLPRIGVSIGVLPFGYYPFWWGDYQYYYSDGLYYRQYNDQYTVVEPPVGAQINSLPSNAEPITINGEQYYEANGVYYRAVTKDDGTQTYEVAGKDGQLETGSGSDDNGSYSSADDAPLQIGDVVDQLPADSRKIKVNGEKLYVAPDGTYFQEARDEDNKKIYKVVGLPNDEAPADDQK